MFNFTKDYHNDNTTNFTNSLIQQNVPGRLITTIRSTTSAISTKSTVIAASFSLEYFNLSKNASSLLPQPPTQLLTSGYNNESAVDDANDDSVVTPRISSEIPIWLIPCYGVILFFAIAGNLLVISTLVQNRRMRTITNVFLLNLAISDILLGVLCMPVTLVGTLLRHFIFGEFLCKLIQFSQAASVAVSSWTLVAISCERYYAICHPLRSRTWQTINHAYRIIGFIWFGSIICMTPIAIFSQLIPTSRQGLRKCREQWPEDTMAYERSYNIFLDLVLLVLPLFILCVAYILITRTLYVGMREERALIFGGSTLIKQHDDSPLEAVATVTKSTAIPAGATLQAAPSVRSFNLRMSLRCHQRKGGIKKRTRKNVAIETQCDIGYHQQKQQQQQQVNCYDDSGGSGGGGDDLLKPFSTASPKAPQSLCGLRALSCLAIAEQRTEVQSQTTHQQQQQQQQQQQRLLLLQQNNMDRHLHGYNNNGNHHTAGSSSESTLFDIHQQNRLNSGPHLRQHNSTQLRQQHQKPHLLQQTPLQRKKQQQLMEERRKSNSSPSLRFIETALRRSNETKNLESKKRVVKMLFVLVLEFFICWTPLYVINTVAMFIGPAIYEYIDYTSICFFQLLAYSSSCCNPITYCFMNASFRRAFLDTFKGLHLNGNSDGADGASVSVWRRRRKGDGSGNGGGGNGGGCVGGGGSRSGIHLSTLGISESIEPTNNAIIVPNNTSMHDTQQLQRN